MQLFFGLSGLFRPRQCQERMSDSQVMLSLKLCRLKLRKVRTLRDRQLIKTNSNTKMKSRNDYEEIVLQLQVTVCMDSPTKGILNRHQQQMHFAIADCLSQTTLGATFNASHLTLVVPLGSAVPPFSWIYAFKVQRRLHQRMDTL